MKLALPTMLLTAVLAAYSVSTVHADITTVAHDSVTISGLTMPEGSSSALLNSNKQDTLTGTWTEDYVILGKSTTSDSNGRYKVTSDLFGDGSTIVIGGGSYSEAGQSTEFGGGQLFIEAWGTQGVSIDNNIVVGASKYAEEADGNNYGGALRLHESDTNRKIVLSGSITLLDNAHFSVGTSGTAARDQVYLEGNIDAATKNLAIDTYSNSTIKLSGGATINTLSGSAGVRLANKKSDGSSEAAGKTYTLTNATGTGVLTIDGGVTLNLMGHASDSTLQTTDKEIKNSGTIFIGSSDITKKTQVTLTHTGTNFGRINLHGANTLYVNCEGTFTAHFDMNGSGDYQGNLVIGSKAKVTATNNMWFNNNNGIDILAGGQLIRDNMTIKTQVGKDATIRRTNGTKGINLTSDAKDITMTNVDLTLQRSSESVVSLVLKDSSLVNNGSGDVRENNGANKKYIALNAAAGNFVLAQKGNDGVTVETLTLAEDKSLTTWVGDVGGSNRSVLTVEKSLTAGSGASIFNSLVLADKATLDFDGSITLMGTLTLGSNLVLADGMLNSDTLTLFTGVTALTLGTTAYTDMVDASTVFSGLEQGTYNLVYSNNTVSLTASIPEPTTATLSLLALAGLAARRRRK